MVEPPVHLFPGITPQAEGWGVLIVVEFGFEERDWCDGTWSRRADRTGPLFAQFCNQG